MPVSTFHPVPPTGDPSMTTLTPARGPRITLVGLTGRKGAGKDTAATGLTDLRWRRIAFADPLKRALALFNPPIEATGVMTRYSQNPLLPRKLAPDLGEALVRALVHTGHDLSVALEQDPDLARVMVEALDPFVTTPGSGDVRYLDDLLDAVDPLDRRHAWDRVKRSHPAVRHLLQRLGTESVRRCYRDSAWIDETRASLALMRERGKCVAVPDVRFANEAVLIHDLGGIVVRVTSTWSSGPVDTHVSEAGIPDELVDDSIHNDPDTIRPVRLRALLRETVHRYETRLPVARS